MIDHGNEGERHCSSSTSTNTNFQTPACGRVLPTNPKPFSNFVLSYNMYHQKSPDHLYSMYFRHVKISCISFLCSSGGLMFSLYLGTFWSTSCMYNTCLDTLLSTSFSTSRSQLVCHLFDLQVYHEYSSIAMSTRIHHLPMSTPFIEATITRNHGSRKRLAHSCATLQMHYDTTA